ncbi:hypothetical protein [Glaciihabitans arcticus]|uniref:hypothetical protein n=1 Tax=Glaciihabitans arcticus TaxID=2668039 RepID=UPI001386A140|nr:hypothetical protein [Glaciihabitans arcticus]
MSDRDAAARSARAATESLSMELTAEEITSRRARYHLGMVGDPHPSAVEVEAHPEWAKHGFLGHITISDGFRNVLPPQRTAVMAEAVYLALRPLALEEHWAPALEAAMGRVRANDYRCSWVSSWKRAPDRTHAVRIVMEIADDGYGRWHVETGKAGAVLRSTEDLSGWTWVKNFETMAKEMRFDERGRLVVGRGSGFLHAVTTIDITTGEVLSDKPSEPYGKNPVRLNYSGMPGTPVPPVRVVEPIDFSVGGGAGPLSARVNSYHSEAERLDDQLFSETWDAWWRGVGVPEVFLPIEYFGGEAKVSMRLTKNLLTVKRHRPPESVPLLPGPARKAARADVEELVKRVRKRFDLPEPPRLT